jgi:hypothetical protein
MKFFSTTGLDLTTSVPLSTAVVCWHQLETLGTEAVDGLALHHLSTLLSLEHLRLSFLSRNRGSFKYNPPTLSNPIRRLTIRTQNSELCAPCLK